VDFYAAIKIQKRVVSFGLLSLFTTQSFTTITLQIIDLYGVNSFTGQPWVTKNYFNFNEKLGSIVSAV